MSPSSNYRVSRHKQHLFPTNSEQQIRSHKYFQALHRCSLNQTNCQTSEPGQRIRVNTRRRRCVTRRHQGLPHLIRCLGVYWQVLLHLASSGIKDSLCRAFQTYQDRLLLHYTIYTWESVRVFHIIFHRGRVYQGVNDPAGWRRIDTTVENMYLTRRTPNLSMTGGTTKTAPGINSGRRLH